MKVTAWQSYEDFRAMGEERFVYRAVLECGHVVRVQRNLKSVYPQPTELTCLEGCDNLPEYKSEEKC
jgi:hypothetical protein